MKIGEFVQLKMDGSIVMILDKIQYDLITVGAVDGYIVRLPDYSTLRVAYFELQPRIKE